MPVFETWPEYVRRVTRGHTQAQIAKKSGVAESNIGRWIRGEHGQPKPDNVLALAKAFGQPVVEALVAAGYLSADEVNVERTPLSAYTDIELLDELRRRTVK
jgi:transcriptional regulator with XRE-family HTH domain